MNKAEDALGPANRRNFLDLLQPPENYRLEWAIGTTFSLDFTALTAAMLAMLNTECEEESFASPDAKLLSIVHMRDRLSVFVNRGNISVAGLKSTDQLVSLFSPLIHEVKINTGSHNDTGSFHPKIWVQKFVPMKNEHTIDESDKFRLIVTSRNLTTGKCWELLASLEGTASPKSTRRGQKRNHRSQDRKHIQLQVDGLCSFLAKLAPSIQDDDQRRTYQEKVGEISQACFSTADLSGVKQLEFGYQWPKTPWSFSTPVSSPNSLRSGLIISPFLGRECIINLAKRLPSGRDKKLVLVSTENELAKLYRDDDLNCPLNRIEAFSVVSGTVNAEQAQEPEGIGASDESPTLLDLHAKFYHLDTENVSEMWIGSPNASRNAWGEQNAEAALRMETSFKSGKSIVAFVYTGKTTKDAKTTELSSFLRKFELPIDKPNDELVGNENKLEQAIDSVARMVAAIDITVTYDDRTLVLTVKNDETFQALLPQIRVHDGAHEMTVKLCPLSLTTNAKTFASAVEIRQFVDGAKVTFLTEVYDVTDLICCSVTGHAWGVTKTKSFIVKASGLTKSHIARRDSELRKQYKHLIPELIQAIIDERLIRADGDGGGGGGDRSRRPGTKIAKRLTSFEIEHMLKRCSENPYLILRIHELLLEIDTDLPSGEIGSPEYRTFILAMKEAYEIVNGKLT